MRGASVQPAVGSDPAASIREHDGRVDGENMTFVRGMFDRLLIVSET